MQINAENISDILSRPTTSIDGLAAVLGISRSLAYRLAQKGKIQSVRIGGRVIIPTAPLREMLRMAAAGQQAA